MYCTSCGSKEHTAKNCPKTNSGSVNRYHMYCTFCGSTQHNLPACPHTWGGVQDDSTEDDYVKDKGPKPRPKKSWWQR